MDWDQAVAVSLVHQNSVPSVQMHRKITAILRAMAPSSIRCAAPAAFPMP
jgi:hypothetical protein